MSLYIQHGYGKGDRLDDLAAASGVSGIILSPADESGATLLETARFARQNGWEVLIDPQSYIYCTQPPGSARFHSEHELAFSRMGWSQSAKETERQVEAVYRLNSSLRTTAVISPGVFQFTPLDVWSPLGIQLSRTAVEKSDDSEVYGTIAIDEAVLADWKQVEDWLDVITTVEVDGFYLVVSRAQSGYPHVLWAEDRLVNLLRLIYVLSELNEFKVIWGYSDIDGLLGIAAGAHGLGAGWAYGHRQFNVGKWQPGDRFGRHPKPRVHVGAMWSPILLDETVAIVKAQPSASILPDKQAVLLNGLDLDNWTRRDAQIQHLSTLARRSKALANKGSVQERVRVADVSLRRAASILRAVADAGVAIEPGHASRISIYRRALERFRDAEGI